MDARQAYERDALLSITRAFTSPAISDADRDNEHRAQKLVEQAFARFISDLQDAAAITALRKDVVEEVIEQVREAKPDMNAWDEAVAYARRGF